MATEFDADIAETFFGTLCVIDPRPARLKVAHSNCRSPIPATRFRLGLIVCEIARAHDGTLGVDSTLDEARFTFRMPVN